MILVIEISGLLCSCASAIEKREHVEPAGAPTNRKPVGAAVPASRDAGDADPAINRGDAPTPDNRCGRLGPPERVQVGFRETVRTASMVAVTFANETDGNGPSDVQLHLVFQGADEHGNLSPSALRWTPSAFIRAEWTCLAINRCVRLVEANSRWVLLDVSEPLRSTPH